MPGAKKFKRNKQKRRNLRRFERKRKYSPNSFIAKETKNEAIPPRSFVISEGARTKAVVELIEVFKQVMCPNTAIKLKTIKRNVLKDFEAMASGFGVTHIVIFSENSSGLYMKIGRLPHGPTLCFRIDSYTLPIDIERFQKFKRNIRFIYNYAPCFMTNLQHADGEQQLQITAQMFLDMFPTISPAQQAIHKVKRACLVIHDPETKTLEMRNFIIKLKSRDVNKAIIKLLQPTIPRLQQFEDISDFILKADQLPDSEVEDNPNCHIDTSSSRRLCHRKSTIRLYEIGPRMTLTLITVHEGLCTGNVLFQLPETEELNEETQNEHGDKETEETKGGLNKMEESAAEEIKASKRKMQKSATENMKVCKRKTEESAMGNKKAGKRKMEQGDTEKIKVLKKKKRIVIQKKLKQSPKRN